MATVTATFEIRNDRSEEHDGDSGDITDRHQGHGAVEVSERRRREITLSRELEDAEDAVWALEAKDHEIVWDLWEHVNGEEYDEWGFYSPYPSADVSLSLDYEISIHDIVWHISQREDSEPPGVYLTIMHSRRLYGDHDEQRAYRQVRGFVQYLEAMGVDVSHWTHGHDHLTGMDARKFPDEMLDHAGYEAE